MARADDEGSPDMKVVNAVMPPMEQAMAFFTGAEAYARYGDAVRRLVEGF